MLNIEHLFVSYNERNVLSDVSFSLDNGITVLLGQNGAGKTTLLRAIAGTVPYSGNVMLDGIDTKSYTVKQRSAKIAKVSSSQNTLSGITGEALAEMALYHSHGIFHPISKNEKENIKSLAQNMGISHLLSKFLNEMSAGEVQLLRLLAATLQNTRLFLLDEPTASLDYNRTHEFFSRVKMQKKDKIVFATVHDPALAIRYADRILLLSDKGIRADFLPSEVTKEEAQSIFRILYPDIIIEQSSHNFSVF